MLFAGQLVFFFFLGAKAKGDLQRRQGTGDPSGSSYDRLRLTLWRSVGGETGHSRTVRRELDENWGETVMVVCCLHRLLGSIMIFDGDQDHVRVSGGLARSD